MKRIMGMSALAVLAAVALAGALRAADEPKPEPGKADAHGFYELFDGKSLDGWKIGGDPSTFKVADGAIVANGPVSHLFYDGPVKNHTFKNFHLRAEVMTFPNSNSGIYFHTKFQDKGFPDQGFECQVNATHTDWKKTGSLYNVKDVRDPGHKDNEWFVYEIIVKDKQITLKINDKTVNEYTVADDYKSPTPGRVLGTGTFALQGHDPGSKVLYRSVKVQPLDN